MRRLLFALSIALCCIGCSKDSVDELTGKSYVVNYDELGISFKEGNIAEIYSAGEHTNTLKYTFNSKTDEIHFDGYIGLFLNRTSGKYLDFMCDAGVFNADRSVLTLSGPTYGGDFWTMPLKRGIIPLKID